MVITGLTRNQLTVDSVRRFESHPLRQDGALPHQQSGASKWMLHSVFESANCLERVVCMDKEQAIKNAETSLRMEGFSPSADMEELLRRVLDGNMAEEAYLERVLRRAVQKEN